MHRYNTSEVEAAQRAVYAAMPATPQYAWPQLAQRVGAQVWVKHENHTPVGAFKIRGGLTYMAALQAAGQMPPGFIAATRGNHGQSVAFAAAQHNVPTTIVVPKGNAAEKNAAMRALGATLVEHGNDFQDARDHAKALAQQHQLHSVPSYHRDLVSGVMTYWVEFFDSFKGQAAPDVVFVPIGQGSGFCAAAAARAYCKVHTQLVGVVSSHATCYQDSFKAGHAISAPARTALADGLACSVPDAESLAIVLDQADDVIAVSDDEVAHAMRVLFADTHNVAEGAGAASMAAALQQRDKWAGKRVGVTLCGGNVDSAMFAQVLAGHTPAFQ
jgi:threonine dehydratase